MNVDWVQDTGWYADALHFLAAYAAVLTAAMFNCDPVHTAIFIIAYAGLKEYWFDAKYEKNPTQDFWENTRDFTGYLAGTVVAYIIWMVL